MLENVSGLVKGNAKTYLKNIVNRLSKDYKVQVFLLYAASMGIPQIRNRVFIIGLRNDYNLPKLELNFNVPQLGFGVTKKYWYIEGDSIEGKTIGDYWDTIKPGEAHPKRFNLKKPNPDKPCFTILETCSNPGLASVVHPFKKRKLNIEEVRMLCTFPKDYNFLDIHPSSVMGRSVLPVMMANISYQIYLQWLSKTS